jgi:hypothetical protein
VTSKFFLFTDIPHPVKGSDLLFFLIENHQKIVIIRLDNFQPRK